MPFPVSIIKLPNMNYEFVNSKFEQVTNLTRENLRGKRDEEVFPQDIVSKFSSFITQSLLNYQITNFETEEYKIRQTVMMNDRQEPAYIIRVFE